MGTGTIKILQQINVPLVIQLVILVMMEHLQVAYHVLGCLICNQKQASVSQHAISININRIFLQYVWTAIQHVLLALVL